MIYTYYTYIYTYSKTHGKIFEVNKPQKIILFFVHKIIVK